MKILFAAGDIATFPYGGNNIRIEHWRLAEQMGRIAGFNMAGKKINLKTAVLLDSTVRIKHPICRSCKRMGRNINLGKYRLKRVFIFFS